MSGGDDLSVCLDGHAVSCVKTGGEISGQLAVAAEGGVQGAVAHVAGQRKAEAANIAPAGGHDPPIGLDSHSECNVLLPRGEIGRCLAVAAEGGVQGAVGVVAGQGERAGKLGAPRRSSGDDLPVRWMATPVAKSDARRKVGGDLAVAAEGGVQAAVWVVAGQREPVETRVARGDDLPVGLNGYPERSSNAEEKFVVILPSPLNVTSSFPSEL